MLVLSLMWLLFLAGPAMADPLEIAVQDDGAIVHDSNGRRWLALRRADQLGAERIRINVTLEDVGRRRGFAVFDDAIGAALLQGLSVQLTLTWKTSPHTHAAADSRRFRVFVRRAVRRYADRVDRYSIFNEPNCCGWMRRSRRQSLGQTYRRVYRSGYRAVKQFDPSAEVLFGELSGRHHPIGFLRQALCLDRPDRQCLPTYADGLAYHPYRWTSPPIADLVDPGVVDIANLAQLNAVLDEAHQAGMLQTPAGERVPIFLTEFGYHSRARWDLEERNVSDRRRASWLRQAFRVACQTPHVVQMLQYQLYQSPTDWPGAWDTSIINHRNRPDRAFWSLRSWILRNPQCVDDPLGSLPAPTPSL